MSLPLPDSSRPPLQKEKRRASGCPGMPAIPPSLEDLSLELLVNNVQAYAEACDGESGGKSLCPPHAGHPFFRPPPYAPQAEPFTPEDEATSPMDTDAEAQPSLPAAVGNKLLREVRNRRLLGPDTLGLFRRPFVRLTQADLSETDSLAPEDVEVLGDHALESLELRRLPKLDMQRLLTSTVSQETKERLLLLDISYSMPKGAGPDSLAATPVKSKKSLFFPKALKRDWGGGREEEEDAASAFPGSIRGAIAAFSKLQALKLAGTALDNAGLKALIPALPNILTLDISDTDVSDLSPLLGVRAQLRNLVLFKTPIAEASVLGQLECLEALDISDSTSILTNSSQSHSHSNPRMTLGKALLLEAETRWRGEAVIIFPGLRILDLSGLHGNVNGSVFSQFLSLHPRLCFLGLIKNPLRNAYDELREHPLLEVAGDVGMRQILCGLRMAKGRGGCRWVEREPLISAQLHAAFSELHANYEALEGGESLELLGLVLAGMGGLASSVGIQMAATACLYNLCRSQRAAAFPNHLLGAVVTCCLDALQAHPSVSQLAKNVWLTLCNDQILQTGQFDLYRCCHLALESMVLHPDEAAITRMTVAIVSILAAKIPIERTTTLGANARYMQFMLGIVNSKLEEHYASLQHLPPGAAAPPPDVTLKFTLSALWNLTDESPGTSEQFLDNDGLDVVLKVLRTYQDEPSIQTKILGLLNNVAEVEALKRKLAVHPVLREIVALLRSEKIEVSYFAAGILAHVCVGTTWDTSPTWSEALGALEARIREWGRPENEMVAYRSFRPFFPLLCRGDLPGVQLWAVWAVRHVCGKSESRYLPLFLEEEGDQAVLAILADPRLTAAAAGDEEELSTAALILSLCDEIMSRIAYHRRALAQPRRTPSPPPPTSF